MSKHIGPLFQKLRALFSQTEIDDDYIDSVRTELAAWISDVIKASPNYDKLAAKVSQRYTDCDEQPRDSLVEKHFEHSDLLAALDDSLVAAKQDIQPLDIFATQFISLYLERSFDDEDARISRHFLALNGLCKLKLTENYADLEHALRAMDVHASQVTLKKYLIQFAHNQQSLFGELEDIESFSKFDAIYQRHQRFVRSMAQLYGDELSRQRRQHSQITTWQQYAQLFERNIITLPNVYYEQLRRLYPSTVISHVQNTFSFFGASLTSGFNYAKSLIPPMSRPME